MTIKRTDHAREKGIALVYMAVFLVPLLACTGLAVDLGRGYLVRVALARAVDAAALAAARNIAADSSQALRAANNIFNANFPAGFLGVSSVQNPPQLTMTGRRPSCASPGPRASGWRPAHRRRGGWSTCPSSWTGPDRWAGPSAR